MKKKIIVSFTFFAFLMSVGVVNLALAGKDDFTLSGKDKYKPKNIKILKQEWSQNLKSGKSKKRYYPETSQPTLDDGVLYVGTHGGFFYAVDANTGKQLWQFDNESPISSTSSVANGKVFFTDLDGHLVCLQASDGQKVWKKYYENEMLGQPLLMNDRLYILKGEQEIMAVNPSDGHMIWTRFVRTFIRKLTMRGHATIVGDGGSLFIGLADGHLYCLSAGDGRTIWEQNLTVPMKTFKDIDATVKMEGDSLYVGSYSGMIYRLNKSTGSITWRVEIATGVPVLLTQELVIVSDINGSVVGLNKATGKQIWDNSLNGSVLSEPVLFQDKIFLSSFKTNIFLLDVGSGLQVQQLDISSGSINRPIVHENKIYLLTNGAKLIALGSR